MRGNQCHRAERAVPGREGSAGQRDHGADLQGTVGRAPPAPAVPQAPNVNRLSRNRAAAQAEIFH